MAAKLFTMLALARKKSRLLCLGRLVNEFIKLRCETDIGIVLCYSHELEYVDFFTNFAKLATAFTFTTLPLNFYTSVSGCG